MPHATSVFVGGGTPSLVSPADLVAVLDAVPRAPGCEVTVECNPDTVTPELAAAYANGGVNRISLGVQSMVDHVLHGLGRTHDPDNVRRAVALVRAAGIPTFNLDLIYGGAGESVEDWTRTVDERARARPAARQRLRPDRRAGHAAGRRRGAPPRRRRPGRQVPGGRRALRGGRTALVRDLELGPARPRVPAQPAVLVDGRVPGLRLRRALAPRRPPLLERADARAVHRGDRGRAVARGGRRAPRPRGAAARGAAARGPHPFGGAGGGPADRGPR